YPREVLGVRVEIAERYAYPTRAGLNETAGEQKLPHRGGVFAGDITVGAWIGRRSVASEHFRPLLAQVHRSGKPAGSQNSNSLPGEYPQLSLDPPLSCN